MAAVPLERPCFLRIPCHGIKAAPHSNKRIPCSWKISANSSTPSETKKELGPSLKHQNCLPQFQPVTVSSTPSELQFDRMQPGDQALIHENRVEFGQFVARQALLDEEYWTAAWLRAESHWENRKNDRYADSYKRKFAEQEYNALKRRSRAQLGHKCSCIVAVKRQDRDGKHTVLKSVVGTLDVSIQYLPQGQNFPGAGAKTPLFCSVDSKSCHRYGYIANLCVAKSARRRGVASNMLLFAIRSAEADGAEQVFVHVHAYNTPAKELYLKMDFEEIDAASFDESDKQIHLLRHHISKSV